MPYERELKFLVSNGEWRQFATASTHIQQAYISVTSDVEVRIRTADSGAFVTMKSRDAGEMRREYEWQIPLAEATAAIADLGFARRLSKVRWTVMREDTLWEVDVFEGPLLGLTLAEIELAIDDEPPSLPGWIGSEVTHDPRYRNAALALSGLPIER